MFIKEIFSVVMNDGSMNAKIIVSSGITLVIWICICTICYWQIARRYYKYDRGKEYNWDYMNHARDKMFYPSISTYLGIVVVMIICLAGIKMQSFLEDLVATILCFCVAGCICVLVYKVHEKIDEKYLVD